ncbi:transglutaminase-like domain-containing protein [Singulisphaera sp. PoT]|uniref:transglutaminase-like domain-containing protein n=1 Tax=Singulisphaera sp. PoT TaxID=3411797 RepID=UPI003BF47970
MAFDGREDARLRWATLAMAAFSTLALEQAVLEPGKPRGPCFALTLGVLILPMLVASVILAHRDRRSNAAGEPATPSPAFGEGTIAAFCLLFVLPFGIEFGHGMSSGWTTTLEYILIAALRNLGLGLAAFSHRPAHARLSALVSLFLVTVASAVGGEGGLAVLAPAGGFAMAGMGWLMLVYWTGLPIRPVAGPAAVRHSLTSAAWMLTAAGLIAAVAAVGPTRAATALIGLVPTSGGTGENDPNARSGVNDGDNEVDASENPQSVGFTRSEIYLETDRPSLYDAFNESYGEPFKRTKIEKMIALGPENVREQKERPAENLRAGREFSAVRKKPELRPKRPGERAARALVYIKGTTPLHLPLTTYGHFDGTTWHEEPCCNRDLHAEPESRGSWMKLLPSTAAFLTGLVTHQVKIGALDSSSMPLPSHLERFRVGSVDRSDFFGWAQYGIVRMTDRNVPAGTVIDTEAKTVDRSKIGEMPFKPRPDDEKDHHISFRGEYAVDPRVTDLARSWVAHLPEGWTQVEALVHTLRHNCHHDHSATSSEGCKDVTAEFLFETRRGPDYLFATASAVMLRSLGYPVRLVSGLYAAPEKYDPVTRHTSVTRDDVHVWAEVRLPDGLWIAIEPTPGFDLLPPARPWVERVALAFKAAGRWAWMHKFALSASLLLVVGAVVMRRRLLDLGASALFGLDSGRHPRRSILRALSLLERRARWAGCPRPTGQTPSRWYRPIARLGADESRLVLERLLRLSDWALHAPGRSSLPPALDDAEILKTCREALRSWTPARFREVHPLLTRRGLM